MQLLGPRPARGLPRHARRRRPTERPRPANPRTTRCGPGSPGERDVLGDGVFEVLYLPGGLRIQMNNAENKFDILIAKLDELITCSRKEFLEQNIEVIDQSNRPGFRGEWPVWSYRFELRLRNDPEIYKISLELTIESDTRDICSTWLKSEVFHSGQLSRLQKTLENNIRVNDLLDQGLAAVVLKSIKVGRTLISGIQ